MASLCLFESSFESLCLCWNLNYRSGLSVENNYFEFISMIFDQFTRFVLFGLPISGVICNLVVRMLLLSSRGYRFLFYDGLDLGKVRRMNRHPTSSCDLMGYFGFRNDDKSYGSSGNSRQIWVL